METLKRLRKSFSDNPAKTSLAGFLLLFWLLFPPVMQYLYGFSAIKLSLGITITYFVVWKFYQHIYPKIKSFIS